MEKIIKEVRLREVRALEDEQAEKNQLGNISPHPVT